jgi:hemerythrin-like metal-binding protein
MGLFSWTPKMSVGIAEIDKEHQGLFDIMNKLHEAMLSGRGKDALRPVLIELGHYTNRPLRARRSPAAFTWLPSSCRTSKDP